MALPVLALAKWQPCLCDHGGRLALGAWWSSFLPCWRAYARQGLWPGCAAGREQTSQLLPAVVITAASHMHAQSKAPLRIISQHTLAALGPLVAAEDRLSKKQRLDHNGNGTEAPWLICLTKCPLSPFPPTQTAVRCQCTSQESLLQGNALRSPSPLGQQH